METEEVTTPEVEETTTPESDTTLLGNEAQKVEDTPEISKVSDQTMENMKMMWGDLADKIEWPDGTPDEIKLSPSIKPFVGKDGKLSQAELLKSYVHTKKKVGEKGVQVPSENSPQEEWDEYFEKVGWTREADKYSLKAPEGVEEETVESLKKIFHENRVPVKQAEKIASELFNITSESTKASIEAEKAEIAKGVESLKKEWGQAFDTKVNMAKKVLSTLGDDSVKEMFSKDPYIGSNPAIIKFLNSIGEKMYGEDNIPSGGIRDMALTPREAASEINQILGNMEDPYHKPQHPAHKDRVQRVQKLFEYKNS